MPKMPEQKIAPETFDPEKIRLDLPLSDAFALTAVRSLQEFSDLQGRLDEVRGQSYFFVNILEGRARLIMTVIIAEEQEITATYELDTSAAITQEELLSSPVREDGNHPLPEGLAERVRSALHNNEFRLSRLP
ncbi:MAG TPA: hypothetical protein PKK11_07025 [Methanothrix sp.]|nr:hypothetical protein [Methanothrix sp.]HPT20018.1 hypothetical protein [Methanothrix sp.]